MTPHSSSSPSRYVARGPTDLVAIVPVVLGFHPSDSVVLLTFGAPGAAFHARVDLPLETAEQEEVAELLVGAAVANRVERAAVLLYTDDTEVAHAQSSILLGRLLEQQVEVIEVIRVDDDRWFVFPEDGSPGTPYDLSGHPFTAQGVFEGHVVHRDRGELADTLVGTDEDDAVEVALAATRFADLVHTSAEPGMLPDRGAVAAALRAIARPRHDHGRHGRRREGARAQLAHRHPRRGLGRDHPTDLRSARRAVARPGAPGAPPPAAGGVLAAGVRRLAAR